MGAQIICLNVMRLKYCLISRASRMPRRTKWSRATLNREAEGQRSDAIIRVCLKKVARSEHNVMVLDLRCSGTKYWPRF